MAKLSGPGRRSLLIGGAAAAGVAVAGARVVPAKTLAPSKDRGRSSSSPRRAAAPARRPMPISACWPSGPTSSRCRSMSTTGTTSAGRTPSPRAPRTDRQRAYARVLKQRYVYTPEMVVEGIGHDTGRERAGIERLLAEAQRRSTRRATPELSRTAGRRAHRQAGRLPARRPACRRHARDLRPSPFDAGRQRREPGPHAGQLQHRAPPAGR